MADRSPLHVYPPRPIIGDALSDGEWKEHQYQNGEMFLVRRSYLAVFTSKLGETRAVSLLLECRNEDEIIQRWLEINEHAYKQRDRIEQPEITPEAVAHCRAYDRWQANGCVGHFRRSDGPLAAPPPEPVQEPPP